MAIVLLIACKLLPNTKTRLPVDRLTDDLFCLAVPVTEHGSIEALQQWMRSQGAENVTLHLPDGQISGSSEVSHA